LKDLAQMPSLPPLQAILRAKNNYCIGNVKPSFMLAEAF
jgi:hypothetical protein